jgi:hypothetical protein
MASDAQKRMFAAQMGRLGVSEEHLKKKFGFKDMDGLTVRQASAIITELQKIKTWS